MLVLSSSDSLIDCLVSLWSYHRTWLTLRLSSMWALRNTQTNLYFTEMKWKLAYLRTFLSTSFTTHSNGFREKSALCLPVSVPLGLPSACCTWVSNTTKWFWETCVCPLKLMISTCASHSSAFLIIDPHLLDPKNRTLLPIITEQSHISLFIGSSHVCTVCVCVWMNLIWT